MNLKGVLGSIIPTPIRSKDSARALKMDNTQEREGNGQQSFGGQQQQRPPMTDEEIKAAIKHLKELAVVKDNNLQVQLSVQNDKKFILILESSGKVFRRIPESELWSLTTTKDTDKGQLLSKTA